MDGIKPYQKTTPIGQAAAGNDYSKWKYTITTAHIGTIKEGINRITAKLLCQANPVPLTKFYSINVTGTNVPKQHYAITSNNATVVHVSSNNPSSNLLHPRPLINHLSATTNVPKQHYALTSNNATVVHVSSNALYWFFQF